MARTVKKRPVNPTTQAKPPVSTTPKPPSAIPEPFTRVTSSLQPLASTLPTDHVYIVHLDRTPVQLKRRLFLVPVLLNLAIVAGLCVRVYYAAPVYLQQIITIFGYETAYTVDTKSHAMGDLMSITTSRFLLLSFDFALFSLLGSWPREFLFGSKLSRWVGLWEWRQMVWFKETEVVVRRGRRWDTPLLEGNEEGNTKWNLQDELNIKFKIEPAMRPSYTSKSGLGLLDKDWDLDYKAMVDAHRMTKDGRLKEEDLDGIALVFYQKQWLLWQVRDNKETPPANPEQENVLQVFKQKLTSLGQEDVFFRWIEIVQFESSQSGGFNETRKAGAIQELKKLLTNRGVDYASFWESIGGQNGLPGLNENSAG